jgi:hypothetical protein
LVYEDLVTVPNLRGLVGCWSGWSGWSGHDPRGPSHSIPNVAPGQRGTSGSSGSGSGAAAGQQRGQLGSGGSSGSGGNGPQPPGAGDRPTQKQPFRATIFRRRGLGYIPPLLERLRGAFLCVRAPSRYGGAVYGRLSAARAGSGGRGVHSLVRCSGGGLVTPAAGSAGVCRGANLGGVFAKGGKESQCDLQTKVNLRCNPLHEKAWHVRLYPRTFGNK